MKNENIEKLANHFIKCFKLRAYNTEYTHDPKNDNSFDDCIIEESTDMLFQPSFRKETESMTNEQYRKYIRKVLEDAKGVKEHDPLSSPVSNPEPKEDSFLGNATNS